MLREMRCCPSETRDSNRRVDGEVEGGWVVSMAKLQAGRNVLCSWPANVDRTARLYLVLRLLLVG